MKNAFYFLIFLFVIFNKQLFACTSPSGVAGQIQWIATQSKVMWCDGSNWRDPSQSAVGTCAAGEAGLITYSAGDLRYCNGSNLISMKGSVDGAASGAVAGSFSYSGGMYRFSDGVNLFQMEKTITCPAGFVLASGSTAYGTTDFCIMKYEARNVSGVPTSHEIGTPWVSISATNAKAECMGMNSDIPGTGGTFDLISNDEWMTIARDAESVGSNWSGGSPGAGHMPQGWAASIAYGDSWNNSQAAPNSEPSCLYNIASNTCGSTGSHRYRRTLELSTGGEVWDFFGNVWQWVDWVKGGSSFDLGPTTCSASWTQLDVVNCIDLDENRDLRPSNPAYNSTQGVGQFYGGSGGAALRGAFWNFGSRSGAFALNLSSGTADVFSSNGFRCVWRP